MNTYKLLPIFTFAASFGAPASAFAQGGINTSAITPYSQGIVDLINGVIVPVLLAIAFLIFLWGLYKYFIWNNDSESEKMEGRKFAMWGIIGFVVIFSVWALVGIVRSTLSFSNEANPAAPTFNPAGG